MKPLINIKYNPYLDKVFRVFKKQTDPEYIFLTEEEVKTKVEFFKKEWNEVGEKWLENLCGFKNLKFKHSIIDVHVICANPHPNSNPIILGSKMSEKNFITVLFHEITHKLHYHFSEKFKETFKSENKLVQDHIATYALMKKIIPKDYLDLERKVVNCEKYKDYDKAFKIVDSYDDVDMLIVILTK